MSWLVTEESGQCMSQSLLRLASTANQIDHKIFHCICLKSQEQNAALTQTVWPIDTRLLKTAFQMQPILQTVTSENNKCVWLEKTLHALMPADTQFPQQQLETHSEKHPECVAYKSPGQQSNRCHVLQPEQQADMAYCISREIAELAYTKSFQLSSKTYVARWRVLKA